MMQLAYEPRTLAEMQARKREADHRQAERASQHARDVAAKVRADRIQAEEAAHRIWFRAQQVRRESGIGAPSGTGGMMPRPRQIIRAIAGYYGVSAADIAGPRRTARIVRARQHAMIALYLECPNLSLPAIGLHLGGKDHTTVLHAVRKFGAWPHRVWPADLADLRDLMILALDPTSADEWNGEGCA